jgi:hypothetical protein
LYKTIQTLGIVIAFTAITGLILQKCGVPSAIITTIIAGIFGLFPKIATALEQSGKTKQERIAQLVKDDISISPVLCVFYGLCYLQGIERGFGALFGMAIGSALGLVNQTTQSYDVAIMLTPIFVVILAMIFIFYIAKFITHHSSKYGFLLISIVIVIDQIINFSVSVFYLKLPIYDGIIGQVVVAALLLPGAFLGYHLARKNHLNFLMAMVFKQLSLNDKRSLIDLAQALPGK